MLIDTHAHLYYKEYAGILPEILARAKENDVQYILVPATDIPTAREVVKLAEQYPELYGAVGVHPHDAKTWREDTAETLFHLASGCAKILAVGEIGLDYHYDFSPREKQIEVFRAQLDLALQLDLPVIIHNRESDADMLAIMKEYAPKGILAQFHCFSGGEQFAREMLNLGHYISFTGNITFAKLEALRTVAQGIPLDRLMIETDAPYMAPVPFRGKTNFPEYIMHVAKKHAELRGLSVEEIGAATTANALRFFGMRKKHGTTLTYKLGNSLYINVTNRCNANCVFCARSDNAFIGGYDLSMKRAEELPADAYIAAIGDPARYEEIVFCGYGEPTIRWELVKDIARFVKAKGGTTRMNTNGHGNLINHRDITAEMQGVLDSISISLNTHDRAQYAEVMRVPVQYYDEMLEFTKRARLAVPQVVLSVVDMPGIDIGQAEKTANELGVEFRVRAYF